MKFFSRLLARGFWGVSTPRPFTYNLTEKKYFEQARKRGKLTGLVPLRGFDANRNPDGLSFDGALIHDYRNVFPSSQNTKSAWTGSALSYVEQFPNAFGGNKPGLAYWRDKLNTFAQFQSTFKLLANEAFTWRTFIFKPADKAQSPALQPRSRTGVRFGSGSARWQFLIVDGRFEIARLNENWTHTKEEQLQALLDIESPTTLQQAEIAELRGPRLKEEAGTVYPDAIYDAYQTLSLGDAVEEDGGKFYELTFLPEPGGKLNIQLAGAQAESIDLPEVLFTREPGTITGAGPLTVFTSGAPFLWQTGGPQFKPGGDFVIGPFQTAYWVDSLGDFTTSGIVDSGLTNATLPGTAVTIALEEINSVWFQFRVTSTTSNPKFTPFIYGVQARFQGGPRNIGLGAEWDSSDHLDGAGNPPIVDIEPQCEGDMRRAQYTVTVRDPKGATFAALLNSTEALENRVVDLSIGSALDALSPLLTRGLVKSATLNNMGWARRALSRVLRCLDNTSLTTQICDAWAALDEDLMEDAPAGDRMRLGAYLRLLLLNAGFTEAEVAGIDALEGRILPGAALGETPCVIPDPDQFRGDYLRSLVDKFGGGWMLWQDVSGVWQFAKRSTAVKVLSGHPVAFSSDVATHTSKTYPGRFAILRPLDFVCDSADSYNHFRVEGAVDPRTGQRFVAEWTIHEGITLGDSRSIKFIGRRKSYPTVRDEGLRTLDDVQFVLRSLVERYGRAGRFYTFTSYFHVGLAVGDRVLVDDVLCEIVGISGGSIKRDRMELVAQELA